MPEVRGVRAARKSLIYLQELLQSDRAVTWVLTGRDISDAEPDKPSIGSIIDTRVRRQWHRSDDHVVDTARRGDTLGALESELDRRVLRFDPTAAFIVVGMPDPEPDRRKTELRCLDRILVKLQKGGVVPVVLPPVPVLCDVELKLDSATEESRAAVEEIARRRGAVVVNTAECRRPELLAMALFRTLGLNRRRPEEVAPSPEERQLAAPPQSR